MQDTRSLKDCFPAALHATIFTKVLIRTSQRPLKLLSHGTVHLRWTISGVVGQRNNLGCFNPLNCSYEFHLPCKLDNSCFCIDSGYHRVGEMLRKRAEPQIWNVCQRLGEGKRETRGRCTERLFFREELCVTVHIYYLHLTEFLFEIWTKKNSSWTFLILNLFPFLFLYFVFTVFTGLSL